MQTGQNARLELFIERYYHSYRLARFDYIDLLFFGKSAIIVQ